MNLTVRTGLWQGKISAPAHRGAVTHTTIAIPSSSPEAMVGIG